MGEKDYALKFPGIEDYIQSGAVKHFAPDLEIIYIPEGSHFVHEQFPEKVNQLIIELLDKQSVWLSVLGPRALCLMLYDKCFCSAGVNFKLPLIWTNNLNKCLSELNFVLSLVENNLNNILIDTLRINYWRTKFGEKYWYSNMVNLIRETFW